MPEKSTRRDLLIASAGGLVGGALSLLALAGIKYAKESIHQYIEPFFDVNLFGEDWEKVSKAENWLLNDKEREFAYARKGCLVIGSKRGNQMITLDVHCSRRGSPLVQGLRGGLVYEVGPRVIGKVTYDFVVHGPEGSQRITQKLDFLDNDQLREIMLDRFLKRGETLSEHLAKHKDYFLDLKEGGVNYRIFGMDALLREG
jgi:hypothetical protein